MSGPVGLISNFGFSSPSALGALLVVPATAAVVALLSRRRTRYPVSFTNLELLAQVVTMRRRSWRGRVPWLLLLAAVAVAAAALARPHLSLGSTRRGSVIMLVVDDSGSMQATDIIPSRLGAVVAVMQGLLATLPPGTQVGLIGSSDQAEVLDPPTTNRTQVESGLSVLTAQGGTALSVGIEHAVKVIVATTAGEGVERSPSKLLPAAVVVGTDGGQNRGTVSVQTAAALAKSAGIQIFGVTVGTSRGTISRGPGLVRAEFEVPSDPGTLALLARNTGGEAFVALNATGLDGISHELGRAIVRSTQRTDLTSWFELVAAVLLVAAATTLRLRVGALP